MRLWIAKLISLNAVLVRFDSQTALKLKWVFSLQARLLPPYRPPTEINEMIQKSFQRFFLNQSPGEVKSWEFISKICKFDVKAELFIRPKMNVRVYSLCILGPEKETETETKIFLMTSRKVLYISRLKIVEINFSSFSNSFFLFARFVHQMVCKIWKFYSPKNSNQDHTLISHW